MGEAFHSVSNIVPGEGIEVDTSDPHNPVVSTTGGPSGVLSIAAGLNIQVDDTDPANPVVSFGGDVMPYITILPEVPGVAIVVDATTFVQITPEVILLRAGDQQLQVGFNVPFDYPVDADVVANLDPATFEHSTIYDLTLDAPLYSNGAEWVAPGGGLASVVAGQNILVDDTDPANPILSLGTAGTFGVIIDAFAELVKLKSGDNAHIDVYANSIDIETFNGQIKLISNRPIGFPSDPDVAGHFAAATYPGAMMFDSGLDQMMYSNGTTWVGLT